ncbi:hypothetical protein IQ62_26710 [Streptomyces scabiei]|nr:hypothetical protein IQ62_26710 [Streptomyces scabiei]
MSVPQCRASDYARTLSERRVGAVVCDEGPVGRELHPGAEGAASELRRGREDGTQDVALMTLAESAEHTEG